MADVLFKGGASLMRTEDKQVLSVDDYHAEGRIRWKNARVRTTRKEVLEPRGVFGISVGQQVQAKMVSLLGLGDSKCSKIVAEGVLKEHKR